MIATVNSSTNFKVFMTFFVLSLLKFLAFFLLFSFLSFYLARGRVSPCAEFNFFTDPEAAFIVLKSAARIRLLPYEVCLNHHLSWV